MPSPRSSQAVGRVGALAVALGIGTAILGFSPAAAADTGAGDSAGSAGQESRRSADSASRTGTPAGRSEGPEPAAAGAPPTTDSRPGRATWSGRGSGAVESDAVELPDVRNGGPSAPVTQAPAVTVAQSPAITPEAAPVVIDEPAPVTAVPSAVDAEPVGGSAVAVSAVVPQAEIAAAVDEAPVMTAAAPDVLADGDAGPTALLGEDGTGEPGAVPLAWAALAVTRREDLAGATPEVAPAAAVGTAETVDAASRVVVINSFSPESGNEGTEITISGSGFLNDAGKFPIDKVTFGCGSTSCPSDAITVAPKSVTTSQIIVVVPVGAQTGNIKINATGVGTPSPVFTATAFTVEDATQFQAFPAVPAPGTGGVAGIGLALKTGQVAIVNQLATAISKAIPAAGLGGGCKKQGCPIPSGETTPTVANTIGMYAFNLVYELVTVGDNEVIGQQLVNLVTQPNVLTFISETVAGNKALATLPQNVATLVGDSVATFVEDSFGNLGLATQFAPFLKTLNLNSVTIQFATDLTTDPEKALLGQFINPKYPNQPALAQQALQGFFQNSGVQQIFGQAVSASISEVLGLPSQGGIPDPTLADYLGQVAASALGQESNPVAITIGNAIENLILSIGPTVAADAGAAFVNLLAQPAMDGQAAVSTTLADYIVNAYVGFLRGKDSTTPPLPFPNDPPLLEALAPAAGVAVNGFVSSLLSNKAVGAAVNSTLSSLVVTALNDDEVQAALANQVATLVADKVKGPLGLLIGNQVGAAVVELAINPVVQSGLQGVVDTLFSDFFSAPGVVDAFSGAAGQWALVLLTTGSLSAAAKAGQQELKASPAIDTGVGIAVTGAVAEFLGDKNLWVAVDQTVSSLAVTLLGDVEVQDALAKQVAEVVADQVKGPLGQFLGAQLGTVVVELVTNPVVQSGLLGVVDTLVSDFWTTPGVVTAFSQAAGDLATAALTGDLDTVAAEVKAALRANVNVQAGVQRAVGAAVTEFLGDRDLWSAVDGTLSAAVINLSTDPLVLNAIQNAVANEVTVLIGATLGAVVGPQIGAAVVQFVSDPAVVTGLIGVVDTLFADFFGSPGVVDGFAGAASELALVLVAGGDLSEAVKAAEAELKASPAVQAGVETAIADALNQIDTTIVGNPVIQQLLGTITTNLVVELAGDAPVQAYVADRYGAAVAGLLANAAAVQEIATQLGSAVTGLLAYPGVSTAVTDSLALFAGEWLGGAKESVALGDALKSLRANMAFVAGVNAVIPPAVNTILADPAVLSAIGVLVQDEAVSALQGFGIKNEFLDKAAGQVAKGTALSFLTRKAGIALADDLAVNLALGLPFSDVTKFVGNEVRHKPELQTALGLSIGQGIGSLFGDNIFGRLIGTAAGIPAVITISVVSGLLNFYSWLSGGWAVAPVFGPAQAVPAATDLYVMEAQSAPGAIVGDGQITLAGMAVTAPDEDQPGSVAIDMTVGAGGEGASVPMIVSFRFPLDRLVSA